MKLTGCSKRCYCEYGNVSCQSTCPPVTHTPPSDLQCEPNQAMLSHLPGEDCCLYWLCPQLQHSGTVHTFKQIKIYRHFWANISSDLLFHIQNSFNDYATFITAALKDKFQICNKRLPAKWFQYRFEFPRYRK